MKELLETIAKSLVDNPDNVSVEVVEKEDIIVLELRVGYRQTGKNCQGYKNCYTQCYFTVS